MTLFTGVIIPQKLSLKKVISRQISKLHSNFNVRRLPLLCPYLQHDVQEPPFFPPADGHDSLATKYRHSHLCQNMIQELEHVSQNAAGGTKGRGEAADYATTFFYQVSKLTVDAVL